MKFKTRYGEFETENIKEFSGDYVPIEWLREQAFTEDGREGFYDQGAKTLYLFPRKELKFFKFEDVTPQLNEKEIEAIKGALYMAKETKIPQLVTNSCGLRITIFPSGLMCNLGVD